MHTSTILVDAVLLSLKKCRFRLLYKHFFIYKVMSCIVCDLQMGFISKHFVTKVKITIKLVYIILIVRNDQLPWINRCEHVNSTDVFNKYKIYKIWTHLLVTINMRIMGQQKWKIKENHTMLCPRTIYLTATLRIGQVKCCFKWFWFVATQPDLIYSLPQVVEQW